jgi:hypothetical protein
MSVLVSSTLVREAASISIKSRLLLLSISRHESHFPHGVSLIPSLHKSDFANIRAMLVLPTPRVPENKYALCILLSFIELLSD